MLHLAIAYAIYRPTAARCPKHDTEVQANKFLNGIIAYLFLPLTAGYLLVLYVYAIRIIANWQLPNGWVSWLTIAIMAICIIIEFCLYPTRMVEKKRKLSYWHAGCPY